MQHTVANCPVPQVKHPTRGSGGTLVSHSSEFREEEKRFAEFQRRRKILDRLAR